MQFVIMTSLLLVSSPEGSRELLGEGRLAPRPEAFLHVVGARRVELILISPHIAKPAFHKQRRLVLVMRRPNNCVCVCVRERERERDMYGLAM